MVAAQRRKRQQQEYPIYFTKKATSDQIDKLIETITLCKIKVKQDNPETTEERSMVLEMLQNNQDALRKRLQRRKIAEDKALTKLELKLNNGKISKDISKRKLSRYENQLAECLQ